MLRNAFFILVLSATAANGADLRVSAHKARPKATSSFSFGAPTVSAPSIGVSIGVSRFEKREEEK